MTINYTYLYLLSPLHTGGTTQEGNLLGIARESHTNFSYIPSSSIRGRLRASVGEQEQKFKLFGTDLENASQLEQGTIWIGDGSLLWLPVPSLSHGVVWISCPMLLKRWARFTGKLNQIPVEYSCNFLNGDSAVYLKDAILKAEELKQWQNWQDFIPQTPQSSTIERLIVIPDKHCATLIQMSLWRQVKIKLDENKTVDGGFRYEEAIPSVFLNMSSILLSFVGNQDPGSEQTNKEGSIVSLVRHLLEQNNLINRIILLYTQDTKEAAILTKEWLIEEISNLKINQENLELVTVDKKLSQDPVDLLLAIQVARQALEQAKSYLERGDFLELNASSGTPAMKSTWSILQAAGYAPQSRVWQIRNPEKTLPNQSRVFETNVNALRKEFDLQIIRKQIDQYDYSGALITFQSTNLKDNGISILLKYGAYRLACAFEDAWKIIGSFRNIVGEDLYQQSKNLAVRKHKAILVEIYWQAQVELRKKQYSNCLVKIFAFEESAMRFILKKELLTLEKIDLSWLDIANDVRESINKYDNGKLNKYLDKEFNCPTMIKIIKALSYSKPHLVQALEELDNFRKLRNYYIHELKGISEIDNPDKITLSMRNILKSLKLVHKPNPFDTLNQQINILFQHIP